MLLLLLVVVWLFVAGFGEGGGRKYLTTFNFNAFILLSRLLLLDDKKLF